MSSGGYDGFHPSSSFGYGDSWRPSGLTPPYERPLHFSPRRRSPSPLRRYRNYDSYYPEESSYRPNGYRPSEETAYYSRSPSPNRYSARFQEPDPWDRTTPWVPTVRNPTWQEMVTPISPTSSAPKFRNDVLATRMFEPSVAWKQSHTERPVRNDTGRTPSFDRHTEYRVFDSISPDRHDHSPFPYPNADRYRPLQTHREPYGHGRNNYDSYRPVWSPRSPTEARKRVPHRSSSRYDNPVSSSGSIAGSTPRSRHRSPVRQQSRSRMPHSHSRSHYSSSRDRRSISRSQSHEHRSSSRSRRSLSREPHSLSHGRRSWSRGRSRSRRRSGSRGRSGSPRDHSMHKASPKSSWDHLAITSHSGISIKESEPKPPTKPFQRDSWTRSASRSSIASSRVSVRTPSPSRHNLSRLIDTAEPISQTILANEYQRKATTDIHVEMELPPASNTMITELGDPPGPVEPALVLRPPYPSPVTLDVRSPTTANHNVPMSLTSYLSPKSKRVDALTSHRLSLDSPLQHSDTPHQLNGTPSAVLRDLDSENVVHKQQDINHLHTPGDLPHSPPADTTHPISSSTFSSRRESPEPLSSLHHPRAGTAPNNLLIQEHGDPSLLEDEVCSSETISLPLSVTTLLPEPEPPHPPENPSALDTLPERIPDFSEPKSTKEALRIVVRTRFLCDYQSREERVNPVLMENLSTATRSHDPQPSTAAQDVIKEVTEGHRLEARMNNLTLMRGSLVERFKERQDFMTEKARRLREEYLALHERWLAHCAILDEQSKPPTSTEVETVQPSGRTTRRSMANLGMGDAVRSDLEMEQIIASLGNDEATDPNQLSLRNLATIPDMISVTHGKVDHYFDDTNHLIGSPGEYYGPQTGIQDWTHKEKEIFLDTFAAHPKQFGLIAAHLPNKTAAQCVDYYYLHKKKFIDFRMVISQYAPNKRRRRGTGKKKGNGLLADIRQHDAEVHRDSDSPSMTGRPNRGRKTMTTAEPKKLAAPRRRWVPQLEGTISMGSETPTPEPETRPRRRRTAMAINPSASTSLEDGEEEATDVERPTKRVKRTRKVKSAALVTEEVTTPEPKVVEQTDLATRRKSQSAQWSEEDKNAFLALLAQHGDDFKRIAASMPNKTTIQVNNYYKANLIELDLETVAARAPKRSLTPEVCDPKKGLPSGPGVVPTDTDVVSPLSPPMSSLNPERSQACVEVTSPPKNDEVLRDSEVEVKAVRTQPLAIVSDMLKDSVDTGYRTLSPSQVLSYPPVTYPAPNRRLPVGSYVSNPTPLPSYPSSQVAPYSYPSYPDPRYPQYDSRSTHHSLPNFPRPPHPIMTDSLPSSHKLTTVRTRENPYPVLPPAAPYYPLESS